MRVAAMQMGIMSSKEKNLATMLGQIDKAKDCDVICFPEHCLQYDHNKIEPIGKDIKVLSGAARRHKSYLIFGSYVRKRGKIKNRLFVMDKKGVIIHTYDKSHAYMTEKSYLSEGRTNKPFAINGVKCAVINCWDYAFPEYSRNLAKQGALVIFCPAYLLSHPRTKEVLDKIPQIRAFDCMSYFVMVDAFAKDSFKRSKICHPLRQLASIEGKEGIIYADVDVSDIRKLRKEYKNF